MCLYSTHATQQQQNIGLSDMSLNTCFVLELKRTSLYVVVANISCRYAYRVSAHASYYHYELNLNTWNLPEDIPTAELDLTVIHHLNKKPRKDVSKEGHVEAINEVEKGQKSIREAHHK